MELAHCIGKDKFGQNVVFHQPSNTSVDGNQKTVDIEE